MTASKSILVADDSASVRRHLRQALEPAGFEILEAENGERGLAIARERSLDLMIIDINMPIMDGFEMIAKVRALEEHRTTPIFVLTTESGASAALRGKSAGATAWIVKPISPEVLVAGIRKMLGQ
jgi:two-component system chemotaxis response regulator CheY